jgi:hypothetical protein
MAGVWTIFCCLALSAALLSFFSLGNTGEMIGGEGETLLGHQA